MLNPKLTAQEKDTLLAPHQRAGVQVQRILEMLEMYIDMGHEFTMWKLQHCVAFEPAPLPRNITRGPMKECYRNAAELAIWNKDMTYVEGWAHSGLIAVEHAWCVDKQGKVVDPTWPDVRGKGFEFLGVPLSTEYLIHHLEETQMYGIFCDYRCGLFHNTPLEAKIHEQWLPEISARPFVEPVRKRITELYCQA